MALTIHHGANGSYKSSGVVQDYIVPAATIPTVFKGKDPKTGEKYELVLNGRVVVTNLRGMSTERTYEVLGAAKCLSDFEIIYVDSGTTDGLKKLLTFWHWAPQGALLVFDEGDKLFPKHLKPADIDKLKYGYSIEDAEKDNRPHEWGTAWREHRHYNWDIVVMTPDIEGIRDDIRSTCEGAYRHVNSALLGFKGRYKEGFHIGNKSAATSNILSSTTKKVRPEVFELYDSSKTGLTKDTHNGVSLWSNPRFLVAMGILTATIGYNLYLNFWPKPNSGARQAVSSVPVESGQSAVSAGVVPVGAAPASPVPLPPDSLEPGTGVQGNDLITHPLAWSQISIVAQSRFGDYRKAVFLLAAPDGSTTQRTSDELMLMGYVVRFKRDCFLEVGYLDFSQNVFCGPRVSTPAPARPESTEGAGGASAAGEYLAGRP